MDDGDIEVKRFWEHVGYYQRKKRSWKDELRGLYIETFSTTYRGGGGQVWKVKEEIKNVKKGEKTYKEYYTVSSCYTARGGWPVYTHYILNNEGVKKIVLPLIQ